SPWTVREADHGSGSITTVREPAIAGGLYRLVLHSRQVSGTVVRGISLDTLWDASVSPFLCGECRNQSRIGRPKKARPSNRMSGRNAPSALRNGRFIGFHRVAI